MSTPRSRRDRSDRVAVIACGALAEVTNRIVAGTGWPLDVFALPPLLHNRPERIAGEVSRLAVELTPDYRSVAVGYADCGTNGALDEVCERLGLRRVAGLTCYDLYAGADVIERLTAEQPGTFFVTDYLAKSFHRSVIVELGLDRWPELRDDYFRHYTQMVWLAQDPGDSTVRAAAEAAATAIGLPLQTVVTGESGLMRELAALVESLAPGSAPGESLGSHRGSPARVDDPHAAQAVADGADQNLAF